MGVIGSYLVMQHKKARKEISKSKGGIDILNWFEKVPLE